MKIIFSSANEAVIHDKWVPVTNAWRVLWLWTKERPRIRTVAANISTKRPHKPKRGGPPACELGELLTTLLTVKTGLVTNVYMRLGPGMILWYHLGNGKGTRDLVYGM